MTLREHPCMWRRGKNSWPPFWSNAMAEGSKRANGEVGILRHVHGSPVSTRCLLVIEYDGERFIGILVLPDSKLCRSIVIFLRNHVGRPIREIGELEIGSSLDAPVHVP
jgi:hypothetical protein